MSLKYTLPPVFFHLTTFRGSSSSDAFASLKVIVIFFIFHFSFLFDPSVSRAQNIVISPKSVDKLSWKAHEKLGIAAVEMGKIAQAAEHFDAAFLLKPEKLELAYNAAIAFQNCRDYAKAAERFQNLLNSPKYPRARLDYARALQQKGEFDEAIPEFSIYLNSYNGKDREIVSDQIEAHINGCLLGIKQTDSLKLTQVKLEHLDINTADNDIAPVPFGEDVLYFTTINNGNNAKIYRSQQANANAWSAATPLSSLRISEETPFGNGTFSPDGSRFYCTMCQSVDKSRDEKVNKKTDKKTDKDDDKNRNKKRICGIYFLKRTRDGWTTPVRLSDRINAPEGNTTHAFVMHKGNKEIMFFASNRAGGQGGMDIWLTTRFRADENSEFEAPLNVGAIVNTEGDEVTPFYDAELAALYFASNGRATLGGLDIFRSEGFQQRWSSPANIGSPYNSSADDYYFAKNTTKTGGFFVSNRSYGMEKIGTRDDDIFQFLYDDRNELTVAGQVFDKKTALLLENARISLYEKRNSGTGDARLLSSTMCPMGVFKFPLLPKKSYTLEIEKDGFRLETMSFLTTDSSKIAGNNRTMDFFLEPYVTLVSNKELSVFEEKPEANSSQNAAHTEREVSVKKETIKPLASEKTVQNITYTEGIDVESKNKNDRQNTKSIQYKIQVLAYETGMKNNLNVKKLERVEDLGDFETEIALINGKTFKRILITFDSYTTAVSTLQKVKDRSLTDAFLIRYEDGKRTNKSK